MARSITLILLLVSLLVNSVFANEDTSPIVLIMVDGARPDYVNYLSGQGLLPNIKQYFYDEGAVFHNSFTSMSLTVPSWSAILSGRDIDRTAIKGNDIFNRQTKHIENYLDWRRDILFEKNRKHGRAYSLLKKNGHKTILDYFNRPEDDSYEDDSEVFATFFPLNDKFPTYLFATAIDNLLNVDTAKESNVHNALIRLIFEQKNFNAIDRDAVGHVLDVLNKRSGPMKKLILLYFAGVDHYAHQEHGKGLETLKVVDNEIGKVIRAIKRGRYQKATVVLVSDHGSQGGKEFDLPTSHHPLKGLTYGLTATNLSSFLSGWMNYPGFNEYAFNVTSTFAAEGNFSLRNWNEFQLQPFQCTNIAMSLNFPLSSTCQMQHNESPDQVHAGVTTSQTIALPFASAFSNNWHAKNNWYTLTNYRVSREHTRNIIKDLETYEIANTKAYSAKTEKVISRFPLDWLAISVSKESFNESWLSNQLNLKAENDLLLVYHSEQNQALILQKINPANNVLEYRYIPIKMFQQDSNGKISFSLNESNDPFGYLRSPWVDRAANGNFIDDRTWLGNFHSAREWAARYSQTAYPNAVFATYRTFYFRNEGLQVSDSERFDIMLNPKYGHIFTVENDDLETQHGMFQRESVRNTFMIRGPKIRKGYNHFEPVFSVDVLPTVLRASGRPQDGPMSFDGEVIDSVFLF
ncbi:MAG: hypothetical protein A4S09_11965 [Proteobacteria bacterium SG_bin7]|nr:MAG: hypothetical protein A4S09_11965 [Proteobacteria bacterium SG_bin7]